MHADFVWHSVGTGMANKWVRFCLSVLNVVWVISPWDTNVPTFREVLCLINEPVRALFHHAASSAERSCPLRSLQPHNASFFLGSTHGFLLLGCPWQRIIIWIACQSLSSTRCHPHSSALSFQLPLTLSSWPCSCFWGIFPLFLSIPILISYLFEEVMWRLSLTHPSPCLKTPSLSPLTSNCAKLCVWICARVYVVLHLSTLRRTSAPQLNSAPGYVCTVWFSTFWTSVCAHVPGSVCVCVFRIR